jgi:heme/copper-type cytochrome/quinol oxidase subunit 4
MKNYAVTTAWTFSTLFLVLALLGFVSNSMPVERSLFETNIILNLTHLITAIGFAIVAKQGVDSSIHLIRVFGSTYMLISAIGFVGMNMHIEERWSYAIYINFLNYTQFALGTALYIIGSRLKNQQRPITA